MYFDEALILQQLRYTGMLETVRIRRSGYGAKYTFQVDFSLLYLYFTILYQHLTFCVTDIYTVFARSICRKHKMLLPQEFIEQFRVLLPKDVSTPDKISTLLQKLDFDPKTYQTGKTKVSFRSVTIIR